VQVFPIPPGGGRTVWFVVTIISLLVGLSGLLGWVAWSVNHSRAEVSPTGLRLVGDLWGRTIPLERLRIERARVVDLRAEPDLQPAKRTAGTGLGGFTAGWFRLRSGEKALIYLTDWARVVYVPTRDGYSVLLSSHEPDRLLSALQGR